MTDIILSRIEKRLKKVETKISTMKDNYEEMDNNLEDMYETINDLKSSEPNNDNNNNNNTFTSGNNKDYIDSRDSRNINDSRVLNNTQINKIIENIINKNIGLDTCLDTNNLKQNANLFYTKLIQNQPQLKDDSIKEHITYFIEQNDSQRKIILDNFEKVFDLIDTKTPRLFKILNSSLDPYHKKLALNKLQILETMQKSDSEYFKISQWLDTFLDIPFNIYKTPSYMDIKTTLNPAKYLLDSRKHLETIIYGQPNTKQHIIEIVARMIQNPKTLGSVFAIYGEAGTGKTTLIKDGLSHIFGLPFIFISLGGAQDRSTLAGSNYVYEGSACGKIIQSLKQTQCMNPIFYFDELDKTSGTEKGNEIINLLIHLTDYTQNSHFMDDYMDGIAIDLSRATFIFSFNDKSKVSPILLDRMEIIKFNSYSNAEKMIIARDFLLPNVIKNVFNNNNDINNNNINIVISDANMAKIVSSYEGVKPMQPMQPMNNGKRIGKIKLQKKMFCNKKIDNHIHKFGKIMKKVAKRNKFIRQKCNGNGGVRYIKKILERIVSRINLRYLENPALKDGFQNTRRKNNKKKDLKNPLHKGESSNEPSVPSIDEIINEILSNK